MSQSDFTYRIDGSEASEETSGDASASFGGEGDGLLSGRGHHGVVPPSVAYRPRVRFSDLMNTFKGFVGTNYLAMPFAFSQVRRDRVRGARVCGKARLAY